MSTLISRILFFVTAPSAEACYHVIDISRPTVPYIEAFVITVGKWRALRDDMWYIACNQEFVARLKRYFKRVLRRCILVVFKVKASARRRKNNGSPTTTIAVILPHPRYVSFSLRASPCVFIPN